MKTSTVWPFHKNTDVIANPESVRMTVDEFEALRPLDDEGLTIMAGNKP